MDKNLIEAGEIANTHGVRGELRIVPWTDSAEFLLNFKTFYIDGAAYAAAALRVHKHLLIAKLEGIDDINAAMALKGKRIFIDRADAKLPEGTFFLQDILGARVQDESGNEIGVLSDILETPAAKVYVVTGEREHLIPAVPEFIIKTDPAAGIVTVRLIEGM